MTSYEQIYNDAVKMLTPERFKHTIGVVKRAEEYAKIYGLDLEITRLVAIAHDITKNISMEENQKYIKKYNIKFDEAQKNTYNLWHAIIGAEYAKDKYKFTDDMVMAIRYHTTGRENMSLLEKVIYLADATEENRKHGSVLFVDTVKDNIDKGMVEVTKWTIEKLLKFNEAIHVDTINCYNYYVNMLNNSSKND